MNSFSEASLTLRPGKKPPAQKIDMGSGGRPKGRGELWASIQRRQMFCARVDSP